MSSKGIVINTFMNRTEDNKLFGKVGFQTQSAKTDKVVLANMAKIEQYLDEGLLKNLEGETVDDGAVIMFYARVNRVRDASELPQVTGFVDAAGTTVDVEPTPADTPADEEEDDIPF